MANPQIEDGNYLRLHNEIMEHLAGIRIPGEARQVLDCIIRKTYGYQKKLDAIPLSQFCKMTGLSKCGVCKAIKKLLAMNLIITQKGNASLPKKETPITEYRFNKDFETWKPLPKKETLPKKEKSITQKGKASLPKKEHSKDNSSKDNPKDNTAAVPAKIQSALDDCQKVRGITSGLITSLLKDFSEDDIVKELRASDRYAVAHPEKNYKKWPAYFNNWMNRCRNNGKSRDKPVRGWTTPSDPSEFTGGIIKI